MFRGVSVLLLNSFSAKMGFIEKSWLKEVLDRIESLLDDLVQLLYKKDKTKKKLAVEEMTDAIRVLGCFFARTNSKEAVASPEGHPSVGRILDFLKKSDRTICKIFKKLWDYSLKDPAYLSTFLNVLVNWGNNKLFASRYFVVCEGIYGSIFQEASK